MNILTWHVHGSWMTSFVSGPDQYLLPLLPDRGPDGRGRARTWHWHSTAVELGPDELRETRIDIVVLQRPSLEPAENVAKWTAGDGQLAKSALTNAFARLEQLLPFALELKAAQAKAIAAKERPRVFGAGYYGPMVERPGAAPGETLLWKNGLISVTQSAD